METNDPSSRRALSNCVGNQVPRYSGWKHPAGCPKVLNITKLETKYRDIADGNLCIEYDHATCPQLETKYRDIADGNRSYTDQRVLQVYCWKPSTAI